MPISGLVISLANESTLQNETLRQLKEDPRVEIGERCMGRLAIVTETDTRQDDKALWNWLESMPGVVHVDLAFASFESPHSEPPANQTDSSDHAWKTETSSANERSADSQLAVARRDSQFSAPSQNPEGSTHGC